MGVLMKVRCAICGFEGEVDQPRLNLMPIQAFFTGVRRRTDIDVWICDLHK
jgi:hypothetical protein